MTDYDDYLRAAHVSMQFEGYLTTTEQADSTLADGKFESLRNKLAFQILARHPDLTEAVATVERDMAAILSDTPESLHVVVEHGRAQLIGRIENESLKSPLHRRATRILPGATFAILMAIYLGVRLYNATPTDAPPETRAGMEQRAHALAKTLRYHGLSDGRRRGLVIRTILWPIEPTAAEEAGATEFAAYLLTVRDVLTQNQRVCRVPKSDGTTLPDAERSVLSDVVDELAGPDTVWTDPPGRTVVSAFMKVYPCR